MICPHCHNEIPDGSNVCPMCYSDHLTGAAPEQAAAEGTPSEKRVSHKPTKKHPAYTKGSRGGKKKGSAAPMIIAIGLILILLVIIVMIIGSMINIGQAPAATPAPTAAAVQETAEVNFQVYGATPVPTERPASTPTPAIEVTPEPQEEETPAAASYKTLRKGDQGSDVMMLQQALAQLGYLKGASDGNFGTGTQTAVKAFQTDQGLDADGIAGPKTQEALFSISSVTPIPDVTADPSDILDLPG